MQHCASILYHGPRLNRTNLSLTAADERRLAAAIHAILNPLGHGTGVWLRDAVIAVKQLLGADTAGAAMPTVQGMMHCSPDKPVVWAQYAGMLDPMDRRFKVVARAHALGVYNREMLWPDLKAYRMSEYHNEFIVPNRMYDALGVL